MGNRVSKIVTDASGNTTIRDYINGIEYENGMPVIIATEEGRVEIQTTAFSYCYNLGDHLDNVRISFTRDSTTGKAHIIQSNGFYPFGAIHPSGNYFSGKTNKYLYNGKELQGDLGIEAYDFGARFYDPSIARWYGTDSLAQKYSSLSPYAYVANNPVKHVDPDGKEIWISLVPRSLVRTDLPKVQYKEGKLFDQSGHIYTGNNEFALMIRDQLNEFKNNPLLSERLHKLDKRSEKSCV